MTPAPGVAPIGALGGDGVAFSLLSNNVVSVAAGEALGNTVGVLLAQFPQVPPLDQLAP